MKNILNYIAFVVLLCSVASVEAQIKTNVIDGPTIASENPFFDASSFIDKQNNDGKGLLFPRTDLTQWTFILGSLDGFSTFPTAFDGMIVYNTNDGGSTLVGQGIVTTGLKPGFYYFYNPTGNMDISTGQWLPLGAGSIPATTVSNTLTGTNLSTTVNGVTGAAIDIAIPNVTNSIVHTNTAYTILATNHTILCDATTAGFTVTIPSAATSTGVEYVIRKIDDSGNVINFDNVIISNGTSVSSMNFPQTLRIQSDGTNWYSID